VGGKAYLRVESHGRKGRIPLEKWLSREDGGTLHFRGSGEGEHGLHVKARKEKWRKMILEKGKGNDLGLEQPNQSERDL